jgi:N-acyl-D-amino-acid deacylase
MAYDLVIKNALIVDGTGAKAYKGDIAVKDGLIAELGAVKSEAKRTIDAGGQAVAPGFIDAHTHYDGQLLWDPAIDPATSHGVTTILMGNCGFTLAPVRPKDQDYILGVFSATEEVPKEALLDHAPLGWESFGEYMSFMDKTPLGVNVLTQVGHSALRQYVMGDDALKRAATDAEIADMVSLAEEAMDVGAAGVSTSFSPGHVDEHGEHVPSFFAEDKEMEELAGAVKRKRKQLVSINPRSKRDGISEQDKAFMVSLAEKSGAIVTWNDFSSRARKWEDTLDFMEKENARGNKILAVVRCQPAETRFTLAKITSLSSVSKDWVDYSRLDDAGKLKALADPEWRERLSVFWRGVPYLNMCKIEKVENPKLKSLQGRRLKDVAEERGVAMHEAMMDIARDDNLETFFLLTEEVDPNADEGPAERILKSPASIVGISDGGAHLQTFSGADYPTYFLKHWVQEKKAFSLEEGVAALSSRVADFCGITDRGTLEVGKAADMIIFDPAKIGPGTLETLDFPKGGIRLRKQSKGIASVIVNGAPILENDKLTGATPGVLLRG